jgi:hypothetical protein
MRPGNGSENTKGRNLAVQDSEGVFLTAVVLGENHRLVRTGSYGEVIRDKDFLRAQNII